MARRRGRRSHATLGLGLAAVAACASRATPPVALAAPPARAATASGPVVVTPTGDGQVERSSSPLPQELELKATQIRVRLSAIEPTGPAVVQWRQGGEGLGGGARRGKLESTSGAEALQLGEWSKPLSLSAVLPGDIKHDTYFTLFAGSHGKPASKGSALLTGFSKNAVFEVEHLQGSKRLRLLRVGSPAGATVTLVVPGTNRDGFVDRLSSVAEVASIRRARLARLPWATGPLPKRFDIVSDLGGYGEAWGYGVRVSDPSVVQTELQSLLQLGVTGLRAAPEFLVNSPPGGGKWQTRLVGPIGYPVPRIRKDRDAQHEAGCPFGPQVAALQQQGIAKALDRAKTANGNEVWALTVDEIGAITDLADNGKQHLVTCERCRQGFVDYLKQQGLQPKDVGAAAWNDVHPYDIWKSPNQPWLTDRGLSRRAFYTRKFLNVASAASFTPLRDALTARNKAAAPGEPKIYSYSLRGNNFLSNGSSLDYFEFYRHADNAMVWETSNRDARAWPWDSYLNDVQRVLKREWGIKTGIYVKPHRGAPVQRMLSAVARGDSLIYWYTYGPDYWKGDSFSAEPKALDLTSKAAHLLGAAEPYLYAATPVDQPRVAIVRPETTWAWTSLSKDNLAQAAALEDGKWVYTALQHEHVPVDPLDERFLTELDLSRYTTIYVTGTHLELAAARALEGYVKKGGRLVTEAWGLARDESNAPLSLLWPVFGVTGRASPELWCTVAMYRAGQVPSLYRWPALDPPELCTARDALHSTSGLTDLPLVVGREVLAPRDAGDVLARFNDGKPALVRHRYGAGEAWLAGAFWGVEYAEPVLRYGFDMRRDFAAARRAWLTAPVAGQAPLACSDPLVEALLLKSGPEAGHALALLNWAYRDQATHPEAAGLVKFVAVSPVRDVHLKLPSLSGVKRVRSLALQQDLPFQNTPEGLKLDVPRIDEADVVVIE